NYQDNQTNFLKKIIYLRWDLVLLITLLSMVGFFLMYSAAAGDINKWAMPQMKRFAFFAAVMLIIPLISLRLMMSYAYLIYFGTLALLLSVEFFGDVNMGAKRWINIAGFNLQPSELMKIALCFALAKYFHNLHSKDVKSIIPYIFPLLFIILPFTLVARQPDLGTAIVLLLVGGSVFFVAGLSMIVLITVIISGCASIPVIWHFLHDYQKRRILTFLNPENDPLGDGYNIIQSQIAIGSGGFHGKGFMSGSQNQLSFLPEKHTDFIFTMLSEEFGFVGSITVIMIYLIIVLQCFSIAKNCNNAFGKFLVIGITSIFSMHVFINIAMVMGLIPVVGAPLPLLSYGGTMMMTMLIGFGIILNVHVNRDRQLHYTINQFVGRTQSEK
ncbi:MAG: rod shape-determining protein RodA, partial [Pseudomonadota bacterium]